MPPLTRRFQLHTVKAWVPAKACPFGRDWFPYRENSRDAKNPVRVCALGANVKGSWWLPLLGLALASHEQQLSSKAPFTVAWTKGTCLRCKIARYLGRVHFTSRMDAWGIGYSFPPPGAEGAGDYIVVHTGDGGRTWEELPRTWQHAAPPVVSFVDTAHGWMAYWNPPYGGVHGTKLVRTTDGGRHWRLMSQEPVGDLFFSDQVHGIGATWSFDYKQLVRTDDGGRTWFKLETPPGLSGFASIYFLSGQVGWIVDHDGDALLLRRTIDSGHS